MMMRLKGGIIGCLFIGMSMNDYVAIGKDVLMQKQCIIQGNHHNHDNLNNGKSLYYSLINLSTHERTKLNPSFNIYI